MGKWFPAIYDTLMAPLERQKFKEIRRDLLGKATGHVLEIGSGTGVNFPYYLQPCHVTAIEPNPEMINNSLDNINNSLVPIDIHLGKAEELPYKDNSFDTVVATLVFCTIPDPQKALDDIHRVLKPGGSLVLFEHVSMDHPVLSKLQDALTPLWKRLCDGCHLNRDTLTLVENTGFYIKKVDSMSKGLFLTIECYNHE
ncbi:class I SAM-dependent methyltransferase [Tuberibacillus sp. Marseille-P3662]|uniref:class I SAM-dependent methyltransferase n=1 Tax=Tuberibacillus sp. Marseille-P3662 TaxID=1965358 RepID=UPI000A1CE9B5|nr:class I SAM-dependent methyltransferase [Tuberibacillus sp. Marseille-P3662]